MIVDEETIRRTLDQYQGRMTVDAQLADAVKSRVRSDRRKRLAVMGGVMSAVVLVGAAVALDARTSTSDEVASQVEPPGKAVGERLGLEPVAFPGDGCKQWVGYEHDWGYCLDSVAVDETELVLLSQEIMGYQMTDARVAYVTAIIEARDYWRPETPEEKAKAAELEAILDENKPLLDPLYAPIALGNFEGLAGESLAEAAGLIPTKGIPTVGTGAWGIEVGEVSYDLDGVYASDQAGEEWASRLSGRDLRTASVPDVVGLPEAEAVSALESAGFEVEISREYSSDVAEGVVVTQFGRARQKAMLFSPLEILVSKGPVPTTPPPSAPAITMPDLVGLTRQEAEDAIRRLNLYGPFMKYTVGGNPTTVIRQEPAAGTDVYGSMGDFPGTMVNLWIG